LHQYTEDLPDPTKKTKGQFTQIRLSGQCDAVQVDLTFHSHTELLGEKFIEKETKANVKPGTGKFILHTKIFI
jgi:hypothetical protein